MTTDPTSTVLTLVIGAGGVLTMLLLAARHFEGEREMVELRREALRLRAEYDKRVQALRRGMGEGELTTVVGVEDVRAGASA